MTPQNNILIPVSILLAGAMVASAVIYLGSQGNSSTGNPTAKNNPSVVGLGLDVDEFMLCLESRKYQEQVARSTEEAQINGGNGTPFFLINGTPLSGAQPYSVFEQTIQDMLDNPDKADDLNLDLEDFPSLGDPEAPVVLVEYSDFSCSFCKRHNDQTKQMIINNFVDEGLVYYVRKDFISVGTSLSAEAAYCAGEQDAYWDFAKLLYANQSTDSRGWTSEAAFLPYAE